MRLTRPKTILKKMASFLALLCPARQGCMVRPTGSMSWLSCAIHVRKSPFVKNGDNTLLMVIFNGKVR